LFFPRRGAAGTITRANLQRFALAAMDKHKGSAKLLTKQFLEKAAELHWLQVSG
jgi:hypothetical protein